MAHTALAQPLNSEAAYRFLEVELSTCELYLDFALQAQTKDDGLH